MPACVHGVKPFLTKSYTPETLLGVIHQVPSDRLRAEDAVPVLRTAPIRCERRGSPGAVAEAGVFSLGSREVAFAWPVPYTGVHESISADAALSNPTHTMSVVSLGSLQRTRTSRRERGPVR